jgi:hypothetical protein
MRRFEETKEETREGFIENCLELPIKKAANKGETFTIDDLFVGRSLYLILLNKNVIDPTPEFNEPYFEIAKKKLGKKGLVEVETGTKSISDILSGNSKKEFTETPERHENIIMIAQTEIADEWLREAQRNNLNLQNELKL